MLILWYNYYLYFLVISCFLYSYREREKQAQEDLSGQQMFVSKFYLVKRGRGKDEQQVPPSSSYFNSFFFFPFNFSVANIVVSIRCTLWSFNISTYYSVFMKKYLGSMCMWHFLEQYIQFFVIMWYLWHLQALSIFSKSHHHPSHSAKYIHHHRKEPPLNWPYLYINWIFERHISCYRRVLFSDTVNYFINSTICYQISQVFSTVRLW